MAISFLSTLLINSSSFKNTGLQKICNKLKLSTYQCCTADKILQFLGYGGLAVAIGTYIVPFVLAKLSFTATVIIGGSFAAGWQPTGIFSSILSAVLVMLKHRPMRKTVRGIKTADQYIKNIYLCSLY